MTDLLTTSALVNPATDDGDTVLDQINEVLLGLVGLADRAEHAARMIPENNWADGKGAAEGIADDIAWAADGLQEVVDELKSIQGEVEPMAEQLADDE